MGEAQSVSSALQKTRSCTLARGRGTPKKLGWGVGPAYRPEVRSRRGGRPGYRPAVARSSPLARARGEDQPFRNDEKTNCGRTGVPPGGTDIGGDRRTARRCGREGGEDRATARRWPSPFPLCKQGGGGIGFFETTRKRIAEGPVCPKTRFFLDLLTGRTSLTQSTLVSH